MSYREKVKTMLMHIFGARKGGGGGGGVGGGREGAGNRA